MDDEDSYAPPAAPSKPAASKAAPSAGANKAKETAASTNGKPASASSSSSSSSAPATSSSSSSSSSASTSASAVAAKKKAAAGEDEDFGPCMQASSNKTKRMEEEKALKTLKWNFDVPRKEFIEQLRSQMETAQFSRSLLVQLFHDDFKYHTSALQTLIKALDECQDATVSNLDLILRWLSLRFFETNPTVILKAIDYMQALFTMLATQRGYHLVDFEASAFLPYLIGKFGDPKEPIRRGFRQIIKLIGQCYAPVKIFNFLVQALVSKNSRLRADCLEELGQMIELLGLQPFNPAATLKEIAKQIGDRDTSVRNAALNTITIAYQIAGEQVYKFVGRLNEKDQSMLDERIKRSNKPGTASGSASAGGAGGGVKSSASGPINGSTQALNGANGQQGAAGQLTSSNSYMSFQQQQQQMQQQHHNGMHSAASVGSAMNTGDDHHHQQHHHHASLNGKASRLGAASSQTLLTSPNSKQSSSKQQQQQPVKGEFCLDLKDDDDDMDVESDTQQQQQQQQRAAVRTNGSNGGHNDTYNKTPEQDLDDLLNQPIGLPPRKNLSTYQTSSAAAAVAAAAAAAQQQHTNSSNSSSNQIDSLIANIGHERIETSFQHLTQLDALIKEQRGSSHSPMLTRVDTLMSACAAKLHTAHTVYLASADERYPVDVVFKLFKGIFSLIIALFEHGELGKQASVASLKDVFHHLLCLMVDARIAAYPDGDQLGKAINVVTLKMLELADQTASYCALIRLLHESCARGLTSAQVADATDASNASKHLELVMKCIWRQIRRLAATTTTTTATTDSSNIIHQIETPRVLAEIHAFLCQFPSSSWHARTSDLPLRTIKTMLFHLAKARQAHIIDDLREIRVADDADIKTYIMKLFKNDFQLSNQSTNSVVSPTSSSRSTVKGESLIPPSTAGSSAAATTAAITRDISEQLGAMIKRISQPDTSKEALRDLHDFLQLHPDIDLNKYFRNSSGKLQAYIEDNLRTLDRERHTTTTTTTTSSNGSNNLYLSERSPVSNSVAASSKLKSLMNKSPSESEFMSSSSAAQQQRGVDDYMKFVNDWKSKIKSVTGSGVDENQLQQQQQQQPIRTTTSNIALNRYSQQQQDQQQQRSSATSANGNGSSRYDSENTIKAEKYLDKIKDLKMKYTKTIKLEVWNFFKRQPFFFSFLRAKFEKETNNKTKLNSPKKTKATR